MSIKNKFFLIRPGQLRGFDQKNESGLGFDRESNLGFDPYFTIHRLLPQQALAGWRRRRDLGTTAAGEAANLVVKAASRMLRDRTRRSLVRETDS